MYGTKDIPSVGKLEFNWYNAPSVPTESTVKQNGPDSDGNVTMRGAGTDDEHAVADNGTVLPETDWDVADDDERNW